MKLKPYHFVSGSVLILLIAILIHSISSREPAYDGKTLSVWFEEFSSYPQAGSVPIATTGGRVLLRMQGGPNVQVFNDSAMRALRALGSHAVPFLVKKLQAKEGVFHRAYRFVYLKLPQNWTKAVPMPKHYAWIRARAAVALGEMRKDATQSVPSLLAVLQEDNPDSFVQTEVIRALVKLVENPPAVLEPVALNLCKRSQFEAALRLISDFQFRGTNTALAIAPALKQRDRRLTIDVLRELGRFGATAGVAAIQIADCLENNDKEVRYQAACALAAIGPSCRSALPALHRIKPHDDVMVQNAAKRAITAIKPGETDVRAEEN